MVYGLRTNDDYDKKSVMRGMRTFHIQCPAIAAPSQWKKVACSPPVSQRFQNDGAEKHRSGSKNGRRAVYDALGSSHWR